MPADADAMRANLKAMLGTCRECKQPLVEIEDRHRHLTGCLTCNIWWSVDDKKVRLSEQDLRALHAVLRG